jgi:hypothetical protein
MFKSIYPFFPRSAAFVLLFLTSGTLHAAPPNLRGSLGIHDPSAVIQCGSLYYVFGTGQGILSKSSADTTYWVTGPPVFATYPSWTTNAVPGFTGDFWAPDIHYFNGQYYLYYAVSTFGSQVSAIGLATSPTLNPSDPTYKWTDQGAVIESSADVNYNAIDPSVTFDASSNLWMSFGSFWTGIKLIQLSPVTGKASTTNRTVYSLANDDAASGDPIEGSYLYYHDPYYYLFVNWGTCCDGIDSTYNIRVGRSENITGPYLDQNGSNMVSSGGTLFLGTTGKFIAPGQVGIIEENGNTSFGYHYLDANNNGTPTFDFEPLAWTSNGWPSFTNNWSAAWHFHMDARDDGNQYYGLLQNGASISNDPLLGDSLLLNGSNQYVSLPNGAANAQTFAAVIKWNGGAAWQRVFDFGNGTNSYLFLTPLASTGFPRFTITSSGTGGEQHLDATSAVPVNVWTHLAATTDGTRGILYINGVAVTTNAAMTLTAPDIVPTNVWFGRSQFAADPYFNGEISSIRIFGRALSATEIVAPQPTISAPAANSFYQPGQTIQFAGTATDFADSPLSVSGLSWTVAFCDGDLTNVVAGPLSGSGGSFSIPSNGEAATNGFYNISLVATDALGRAATNSVNIFPNPTNTAWTAIYSFNNGATDSNGLFNGTLVNGASTVADPIRGPVLNLSGVGQYVGLPAGIGAMRTFAAWVKWGGGNDWQRIFDFGVNDTSYAMFTAKASSGKLRFEITPNGAAETRDLDSPNPLPTNVWTHVAMALDGWQAVMFVNGQAVAVNPSVNLLPSDVAGGANYFGRSQFSTDPYFNGQMDSMQVSSQTLPIEQITASGIGFSNTASTLTLNWPAWTNGLGLYASGSLAAGANWTSVTNPPATTNGVNFLTLAATNSQMFFRLQLP